GRRGGRGRAGGGGWAGGGSRTSARCGTRRGSSAAPTSAVRDQLAAGDVPKPLLVGVSGPATGPQEQEVDARMVERPKDVRSPVHAQPRLQSLPALELPDYPSLVVVEVAPDPLVQRLDIGIRGCGGADHVEEPPDPGLDPARVPSVLAQYALGVTGLDRVPVPVLLRDGDLFLVASQASVPDAPQDPALRLKGQVDGLEGHARLPGDRRHRGGDVPVHEEEALC